MIPRTKYGTWLDSILSLPSILEAIMAKQTDQDRAIADLRSALDTEKAEISAKLDDLQGQIDTLRNEGQISDASIEALDAITAEIRGIIDTPTPGPTEPPTEPTP